MWGTEQLRAIFNDERRVQKWYDYEAALALSQAELGIIPQAAAAEIALKAHVANVDLEGDCRRRSAAPSIRWCRPCAPCRRSAAMVTANTCTSARPPRMCPIRA